MSLSQFVDKNDVILSDKEKQFIVNLFPLKLRPFLSQVNNPLDETQVLINLFKDKDVRIILTDEEDEFGDKEQVAHFHCGDIAKQIKYIEKNINDWKRLWKIEFITYENLVLKNSGAKITNMATNKRTDNNANFISIHELKKVLLKVNTEEAKQFQEWILRLSTLTSKIVKNIILVKHQLELQKINKQLEDSKEHFLKRSQQATELFCKPNRVKGEIYCASTVEKLKENKVKIGQVHSNSVKPDSHLYPLCNETKKREIGMQTSCPEIKILSHYYSEDINLTETLIHKFLDHLNVEKEFFFISSLDECNNMLLDITTKINEMVNKYSNDYKKLRLQYMTNNNEIFLIENKHKHKSKKEIVQKNMNIYKQYLDERTVKFEKKHIHTPVLYNDFKIWYSLNYKNKIPSNIEFFKNIRKYIEITDKVWAKTETNNGSSGRGIKNLQLIS
jgi:prophage antirepressor-like protein